MNGEIAPRFFLISYQFGVFWYLFWFDMERLTPSEEQVMLRLWKLDKASVKEIVELYSPPRPAYNTVSTIVRILERKKFVKHKAFGRGYIYIPRVSKDAYREYLLKNCLNNYFENDQEAMIKFINSIDLTDTFSFQKSM